MDSEGRDTKKSKTLENSEAHAYYCLHSTSYKATEARKRKGKAVVVVAQPLRIDPHRNADRARYRYLQMTKPEIVEGLLQVEYAYGELAEQQATHRFTWVKRADLTGTYSLRKTQLQP